MKVNAKIRKLIDNEKPLKATCSVILDDKFVIHGVKIIATDDRCFIAMPSESYTDADGNEKYRDICHPIATDLRREMEKAVFTAYRETVLAESQGETNN